MRGRFREQNRASGVAAWAILALAPLPAEDRVFSAAELQGDLRTVRESLERHHPALYAWTSRPTFDALFESAAASLHRGMDAVEFLNLLHRLVARAGCGHTYVSAPQAVRAATTRTSLPATLLFAGGECRIRRTYGLDDVLPPGSQVISINGLAAEALHERWIEAVSNDGVNRTRKTWRINYSPPFGSLAAVFGFPETYVLEIRPPGTAGPRLVEVQAQPLPRLGSIAPRVYPAPAPEALQVDWIPESNAAVFRIRTFQSASWTGFPDSLSALFESFAREGLQNLIIDVRGNGGGDPETAVELLRCLAAEPFVYFGYATSFYASLMRPIELRPERFRGRVLVLADGGCFSTTGHFLSLVRYYRMASIIGEESGGSFSCNDAHTVVALPATGITLNVARYTFATAAAGLTPGRGVFPDYEVEPGADEILAIRDPVLEYALRLAGQ